MKRAVEALRWRLRRTWDRMIEAAKQRAKDRRVQSAMRYYQRHGFWKGSAQAQRGPIWRSRLAVLLAASALVGGAAVASDLAASRTVTRLAAAWGVLTGAEITAAQAACRPAAGYQSAAR